MTGFDSESDASEMSEVMRLKKELIEMKKLNQGLNKRNQILEN